MPYIEEIHRARLDPHIEDIRFFLNEIDLDDREGPSNYTISRILAQAFHLEHGQMRYKYLNRAIGVLEAVKLELYRRVGTPYEDFAIKKNGDIPEYRTFISGKPSV